MWEFIRSTSHEGNPVRRTIYFALATIVATFLLAIAIVPNSYAISATWSSTSSIKYGDNTYNGPADENTVKNLGLQKSTKAFTHVDPELTAQNTATSRKIHVIYFTPDVDLKTNTAAKYESYTYLSTSSFTNPSTPVDIAIDQQPANLTNPGTTSCDGSVTYSLGWIICPVTNFLANGMDWVFNIISSFLTVRPVQAGADNALFRAWTYMRSFANIAFVIAFLIIIYSQLTSFGISNYGIKKLMPRLIIAAILVNISYYICAAAIDISNILGYGVQDIFISIRNGLVGTEGNSWDVVNAKSIAGFVLSGGTVATAGTIGLVSTLSTYGVAGSIFLLLPSLVVALMAILVALVIMAARQAIVTLLVIVAPLAFVAYLLPNTEKWFEKWQSTMLTMLILFPAFSLVFGGSQLASAVIIQNADSINVIILALLVQVAPLFITPMLIQMSGSVLGKIAGMVDNPNKGPIDRVRKFTEDRTGNIAAKRLGTKAPGGMMGTFQRNAQRVDRNRRKREGWKKVHESMADNRFSATSENHKLHEAAYKTEAQKQMIEHMLERDLNNKIRTSPIMLKTEMKVRVMADEVAVSKARLDKVQEDLRAGIDSSASKSLGAFTARSMVAARDIQLNSIANSTAKRVQQANLAEVLLKNTASIDGKLLRDYSGSVDKDNGADSVLANAVDTYGKLANAVVNERTTLIKYFKLSGEQRQELTRGNNVKATDAHNNSYIFDASDDNTLEAAFDTQLTTGSLDEMEEIMAETGVGGRLHKFRSNASTAVVANKLSSKAAYFGGSFANEIGKGNISGSVGLNLSAAKYISEGRFNADKLAENDAKAIRRIMEVVLNGPQSAGLSETKDINAFNNNIDSLLVTAKGIVVDGSEIGNKANQATKNALKLLIDEIENRP